ncbi:MAG: hypothetical protein ISS19_16425 [Bacteroidales bacterium]|nr:hypothetical protein [Bacteroidales bacterium]
MRFIARIIGVVIVAWSCTCAVFGQEVKNDIVFNEHVIDALNQTIDLKDPLKVFEYVFDNLSSEITIYPTENYYYFEFNDSGNKLKGNLALFADTRDQGLLNFSYEAASIYNDKDSSGTDVVMTLSQQHGIIISKVTDFRYIITFKNRSVLVKLNDLGFTPPTETNLMPQEVYVGPSFDESGLKFYLVYNTEFNHLFWVLNEENDVPENFLIYNKDILIGKRTEFAFFNDTIYHRKVLFGVKKENVDLNNWYDGPFDQLPDNFIKTGQVTLKDYLEYYDPSCKGKIDEYGHFSGRPGYRIAISSYIIYAHRTELIKVMMACKNSSETPSEFLFHLTTEREFDGAALSSQSQLTRSAY